MSRLVATLRGSLIALSLLFVPIISAQSKATTQPGAVEKEGSCPVLKPYGELDQFGKLYFPESVYEEARTQTE